MTRAYTLLGMIAALLLIAPFLPKDSAIADRGCAIGQL